MSPDSNMIHPRQRTGAQPVTGIVLNGPLMLSTVAVAILGLVTLSGLTGVLSSVFGSGIDQTQRPDQALSSLVAQHDQMLNEYRIRFDHRDVFFKPPVKQVVHVKTTPETQPATAAASQPKLKSYGGPPVAWVIGEDVYFTMPVPTKTEKYYRVRVGQEFRGVKVLSTDDLPGTVRVEHQGDEYDVKVFGESADAASLFDVGDVQAQPLDALVPAAGAGDAR